MPHRLTRSIAIAAAAAVAILGLTAAPASAAATLAYPLAKKAYSVSSYDGARCMVAPSSSTFHYGLDLAAKGDSPIYSIAPGTVTATVDGTNSVAGYVAVRHNIDGTEYTSKYFHIWKSTTYVKVGSTVKAGQRIASVGTSGVSTGNHLHLEIWKKSGSGQTRMSPASFLKPYGVDLIGQATAVNAKKAPASCTYYTTGGTNLRATASASSASLMKLGKGTPVTHKPGESSNSFIPVTVGGQSGWVKMSMVTPTKPAVVAGIPATTGTPVTSSTTYTTTGAVNLRASASTSAKILTVIPKGKSVGKVKATSGVWRNVTYSGKTGWVHSVYLKAATATPAKAKPAATYKTKAAVNMRAKASMKGKVLKVLPKGKYVGKVKASSGVWRKVTVGGKTGWVHKNYLKKR